MEHMGHNYIYIVHVLKQIISRGPHIAESGMSEHRVYSPNCQLIAKIWGICW